MKLSGLAGRCLFFMMLLPWVAGSARAETVMTLQDCVRLALEQSPRVKAEDEAVRKAEAEIGMARAGFLPTVTAFGSHERIEGIDSSGASNSDYDDQKQISYGIQLNQTLFAGLTILNGYQRAVLAHQYVLAEKQDVISRLTLEVQTAFLDRLRALEEKKSYVAQLESMETNAKALAAMFSQNLVPYSDVLSADFEVANMKQKISETDTYISSKTIALKGLMHIPFSNMLTFDDGTYSVVQFPEIDIEKKRNAALANSPSVALARLAIDVVLKDKAVAMGQFSPKVSLRLSYNNLDVSYGLPGQSLYGSYSRDYTNAYAVGLLNVEWNLFSGGHDYYQVQRLRHEVQRLQNNLQDQENTVYTELERVYNTYLDARNRARLATVFFDSSREQYAMAQSRLAKSLGTLPELMLARSKVQNARSSLIRAQIDSLQALASIYQITGEHVPALVQ